MKLTVGQLLTKKGKNNLKIKSRFPRHKMYVESTKNAHKSSLNVFWTSYGHETYLLYSGGLRRDI